MNNIQLQYEFKYAPAIPIKDPLYLFLSYRHPFINDTIVIHDENGWIEVIDINGISLHRIGYNNNDDDGDEDDARGIFSFRKDCLVSVSDEFIIRLDVNLNKLYKYDKDLKLVGKRIVSYDDRVCTGVVCGDRRVYVIYSFTEDDDSDLSDYEDDDRRMITVHNVDDFRLIGLIDSEISTINNNNGNYSLTYSNINFILYSRNNRLYIYFPHKAKLDIIDEDTFRIIKLNINIKDMMNDQTELLTSNLYFQFKIFIDHDDNFILCFKNKIHFYKYDDSNDDGNFKLMKQICNMKTDDGNRITNDVFVTRNGNLALYDSNSKFKFY